MVVCNLLCGCIVPHLTPGFLEALPLFVYCCDVRTQIETVSPELDGSELMGTGLHSRIAHKQQDWRHLLKSETYQKALQATWDQERARVNNSIARHSAGVQAKKKRSGFGA